MTTVSEAKNPERAWTPSNGWFSKTVNAAYTMPL